MLVDKTKVVEYDYLIVGCGLFGTVFAQQAAERGRKVLVIEKRPHIGGNCYTENIEGINVHKYGPHIFHTSDERVWKYVNRFADFNHFVNRPKVRYGDKLYSFPINLMTLYQLYGVKTPMQARKKLEEVAIPNDNPEKLEEWILSQVGEEIYEFFFRGYTKKQWRQEAKNLPASIIKRLPIRFSFDDNYYDDRHQGIPIGGYTKMFERMLEGIEVKLNTDYFERTDYWNSFAPRVVYTGKIDEYFNYKFGMLDYICLRFETEVLEGDYQGNAVINYTEEEIPYTRVIEHKHFEFGNQPKTVVTTEFAVEYHRNNVPYYPVNTEENNKLYQRYRKEAEKENNLVLGGRLATYSYLDMDDAILSSLKIVDNLLGKITSNKYSRYF